MKLREVLCHTISHNEKNIASLIPIMLFRSLESSFENDMLLPIKRRNVSRVRKDAYQMQNYFLALDSFIDFIFS